MNRIAVTFVLVLSVVLASCGGAADRKAAYMQKAQALYTEGNYEKARLEYKNVLQIDPKDVPARFGLAQTLEKLQDWRGAAGMYLAVIEADPSHKEALARMGQIYLLGRNLEEADKLADKLLALEATNPDGLVLKSGIKALRNDLPGALEDVQKALKAKPGHANASALLASIYIQQEKPDEAIAVLRTALDADPKNATVRTILARVYAQVGKNAEAAKLLEESVKQEPTALSHRLQLASFYVTEKKLDEAEAVLNTAVKDFKAKDGTAARLARGEFLARTRSVDKAAEALAGDIKEDPDNYELRFALGKLYEASNNGEKANGVYNDIVGREKDQTSPNVLKAKTRLAIVAARGGKRDDANRLIGEVLKGNPRDKDALMLRGTLALDAGNPTAAISDFRAALKDNPNAPDLLRALAKAHIANKETDLARDTLKKAVDANPNDVAVHGDLANFYAVQKDLDSSIAELQEVLKLDPKNRQALEGVFKVRVYQQKWDEAMKVADQIKTVFPAEATGFYFAGLVDQAQKKFPESIEQFESALAVAPDAVQPLSQLIKSHLAMGKPELAEKRLQEVLERNGKNFVALNLLGELELGAKKFPAAQKYFEDAIAVNPKWPILYRNLASAKLGQKDEAGAIKAMEDGIQATEGSALLVTGLAAYLEKTGKLDEAIAQYDKILKDSPNADLARNNLAMLLIEYRNDDASRTRAAELTKGFEASTNAAFLDTAGWVAYKTGANEHAIELLEKAVKASPDAAIMHYHLGMAYLKGGNEVQAKDHLKQATEGNADFKGSDEAKEALKKLGDA